MPVEETVEKRAARAAYKAEWQRTHLVQVRAAKLRWYHAHPEHRKLAYAVNRVERIAYSKAWLDRKSPEEKRAYLQARYQRHKPKVLARQKKYEAQHGERNRAYRAKHRKENHAKYTAYLHTRRAREYGSAVNPAQIDAWWTTLKAQAVVACYYCRNPFPGVEMHMDHVIALKRGGAHAISNVCASCPPCNRSKSARLPSEWDKLPQIFLSL